MAAMSRAAVLDPVYFTSEPVYKLSHSQNVLVYIPLWDFNICFLSLSEW